MSVESNRRVIILDRPAMEVSIVFTTQLKAALGSGQTSMSFPAGTTVRQALELLAAEHQEKFSRLVFDDQQNVLPSIVLCVNDQQVSVDRAEPLREGDTLTLLSAISGG